jgi:hypothetical protein
MWLFVAMVYLWLPYRLFTTATKELLMETNVSPRRELSAACQTTSQQTFFRYRVISSQRFGAAELMV